MSNTQTNIELTNQLVIFDIKELSKSLRQRMMLIISNFVQNQVKAKPGKRLLVIDEGWILLEHEESARFVAGLVRRARKYYLGVSIVSQQSSYSTSLSESYLVVDVIDTTIFGFNCYNRASFSLNFVKKSLIGWA